MGFILVQDNVCYVNQGHPCACDRENIWVNLRGVPVVLMPLIGGENLTANDEMVGRCAADPSPHSVPPTGDQKRDLRRWLEWRINFLPPVKIAY